MLHQTPTLHERNTRETILAATRHSRKGSVLSESTWVKGALGAAAFALLAALPVALHAIPAAAQTGGSSGGGSSAGGTSGAPSASPGVGGATGAETPAARSPSTTMPAAPSGPQANSPAKPSSTVPQRDTGISPVPSAGNAEPNSPIYRRDQEASPAGRIPSGDPTAAGNRQPQTGEIPDSTGGAAANGTSTGTSGDDLGGTEIEASKNASSISDEPNRIKRGGGAAGANLEECMKVWDPTTHMSKDQWRTTCKRLGH